MTIAQAFNAATALGLDRLDAQLLLLHTLGRAASDRAWLLAHDADALSQACVDEFLALAGDRAGGQPLAYLTGHKEFYGLNLQIDPRVLVPRPDTETLVDWALNVLTGMPQASVIDLGTGSGAIALALKHAQPQLQVSAIDASAGALDVARANAQRLQLHVDFQVGSWLDGVTARFQVIVSNPPYIGAQDKHLEALRYEPLQALASGHDGLDDICHIIGQALAHLRPGGWLLLEHGYDQAVKVRALLLQAGFEDVQSKPDLSGIERCSGGRAAQVLAPDRT